MVNESLQGAGMWEDGHASVGSDGDTSNDKLDIDGDCSNLSENHSSDFVGKREGSENNFEQSSLNEKSLTNGQNGDESSCNDEDNYQDEGDHVIMLKNDQNSNVESMQICERKMELNSKPDKNLIKS
jgi:hypothetical protein